jgi:hypothetical protein
MAYLALEGSSLARVEGVVDNQGHVVGVVVDHLETGVVLAVPSVGLEDAPA